MRVYRWVILTILAGLTALLLGTAVSLSHVRAEVGHNEIRDR